MPPKPKLHKATGKTHLPPKVTQNTPEPSTSSLSPELQQQFEVELCWCIQQLQNGLKSGKLNNKQVEDHRKALNTLMSNSAPIVKKRQVMRLSFGDYRAKMAAEDKKMSRNSTSMKVVSATPSKKSVFVRKSAFSSSGNSFRFNFAEPKDDISDDLSNIKLNNSNETKVVNNLNFVQSSNSFMFNFNIDNEP